MKKLLSILLVILTVMTFAVSVAAQDDVLFSEDTQWELSEDARTLTDGTREYTEYPIPYTDTFLPEEAYLLEYAIVSDDFVNYDITLSKSTGDIICLSPSDEWEMEAVYVTEAGKKTLDAFYDGMYGCARIYNYDSGFSFFAGYAEISLDFVNELDSFEGEVVTVNVTELSELDICTLYVYDPTDTIEHLHGDIYIDDDAYYYINYDALDNSYFDSEGFFSFRSGTVNALKLDENAVEVLNKASANLESHYTQYDYSMSTGAEDYVEYNGIMAESAALAAFWIINAIFGFIIPLVIGIIGIVLALSKKPGNNKRWLALTALSVLWMIVAAVIIMVVVI